MKHTARIKHEADLHHFIKRFKAIPVPDNGWVVTWDTFKNNRTLAQNRFLWDQVYSPMAEQISEATNTMVTKDMIHKLMADRFSPRVITKVMGQDIVTIKSTTKYTKQEFSDYIEKCFAWGSQHGVWFES